MRKAILPFSETGDDLKQRLQREHNGHKQSRLQMLYLLANATSRAARRWPSCLASIGTRADAG
jgi:hypothetical protein